MNEPFQEALIVLSIALALGLLVGLQREHLGHKLAGLRTFALVTVLGCLAALLERTYAAGGWILAAAFLGVVATMLTAKVLRRESEHPRYGMTTEVALMLMFAVGAALWSEQRLIAVVVGVLVAVLLQFKPELHGIAKRLGDDDLQAIMRFALFSGVILPVLPNETYGPLDVLNPFNIWLMVVLIVGISLGGYIVYKFYGQQAGILMGGILGGAISSTATTVSYAKRVSSSPAAERLAAAVIMISSTVVFGRVLIEIALVTPSQMLSLGGPVVMMLIAAAVASGVAWFVVRSNPVEMPEQTNPTELKPAIIFAGLYALVLLALAAGEQYLPERGTYAIAFFAGLTDMDAITLSTAQMVAHGEGGSSVTPSHGAKLIVVASLSNLLFKWGIAAVMGTRKLGRRLALLFAIPFVVGAGILLLT